MLARRAALLVFPLLAGLLLALWSGVKQAPARSPEPLRPTAVSADTTSSPLDASAAPSSSVAPLPTSAPSALASAAPCSPLLQERVSAPLDPMDPLFHVNRWRAIPADFPVGSGSPWTPCTGQLPRRDAARGRDLVCLPRAYTLRSPEALRQAAWDAPAPGPSLTHDGLPVGHAGRVGFRALIDAARAAGHELRIRSGFRPYISQVTIFRSWVGRERSRGYSPADAERRAAASSAHAGHSEHQLGTTADLVYREPGGPFDEGWDAARIDASAPMRWVAQNAHRFGLVLSYDRDSTQATQYVWEPWHYRFVGVTVADALHRCRLPLESFLGERYQDGPLPPYELP